jgi:enoyl-CoA hydratase/carnithine racemase
MESDAQHKIGLTVDDHDERGCVARITVDHPTRLNILNSSLIQQLISVVNSLHPHERLRVVILTGTGDRAFIGGADIHEMAGLDPSSARVFISRLHEACSALRELPVPVIARISGYCLGAGLEVAASCDLRLAADHSIFGMPEVKVGIPSVIEAALLPRLIGRGKAAELVYTGDSITASEALRCGLVEQIVPKAHLDEAVGRWTHSILEAGPLAVRLQKALFRRWESLPLDRAIELGIQSFAAAYRTDEPRTLMTKFLRRRRKPPEGDPGGKDERV